MNWRDTWKILFITKAIHFIIFQRLILFIIKRNSLFINSFFLVNMFQYQSFLTSIVGINKIIIIWLLNFLFIFLFLTIIVSFFFVFKPLFLLFKEWKFFPKSFFIIDLCRRFFYSLTILNLWLSVKFVGIFRFTLFGLFKILYF